MTIAAFKPPVLQNAAILSSRLFSSELIAKTLIFAEFKWHLNKLRHVSKPNKENIQLRLNLILRDVMQFPPFS